MKEFAYTCRTKTGESKSGTLSAESQDAAVDALFAQDWHILELKPVKTTPRSEAFSIFRNRVSPKTLINFNRQASRLLHAGLPLVEALSAIRNQMPALHDTLDDVFDRVRRGESLWSAFAAHPRVFSPLYVSVVQAGESAGSLDSAFDRLAHLIEADYENRTQLFQSLMYPCSVAVVGLATVFIFSAFVLPRFTVVFEQMGGSLPTATLILVWISDSAQKWWWLLLLIAAVGAVSLRSLSKQESVRSFLDRLILAVPFVASVVRDIETAQFSRSLGAQLEAGLPMMPALEVAIKTMQNAEYKRVMNASMEQVRAGSALSEEMRKSQLFTESVVSLTLTAERSGRLDQTLMEIADDATAECSRRIKAALTLMEPLLILIVGLLVGSVVIAMLLPIFNLEEMLL